MSNERIEFHQNFLDTFTIDELNAIVDDATVVTQNCIVISTEDNFFELSATNGNHLDIYCDNNKYDANRQLTKDEFMKLYKNSPMMKIHNININEEI